MGDGLNNKASERLLVFWPWKMQASFSSFSYFHYLVVFLVFFVLFLFCIFPLQLPVAINATDLTRQLTGKHVAKILSIILVFSI